MIAIVIIIIIVITIFIIIVIIRSIIIKVIIGGIIGGIIINVIIITMLQPNPCTSIRRNDQCLPCLGLRPPIESIVGKPPACIESEPAPGKQTVSVQIDMPVDM